MVRTSSPSTMTAPGLRHSSPYATLGTQELSDGVVQALEARLACLMAQHGQVAVGPSLDKALALAVEGNLARIYLQALAPASCRSSVLSRWSRSAISSAPCSTASSSSGS